MRASGSVRIEAILERHGYLLLLGSPGSEHGRLRHCSVDVRLAAPMWPVAQGVPGELAGALWLKPEFRDELLEVPLAPVHHEGLPIPVHVEGIVHAVYERHDGLILAPELRIGTDDSANKRTKTAARA